MTVEPACGRMPNGDRAVSELAFVVPPSGGFRDAFRLKAELQTQTLVQWGGCPSANVFRVCGESDDILAL